MTIATRVQQRLPAMIDLRHRLHQIPEIQYEEVMTAAEIRAELDRLGIPCVAGVANAPTATIAWLGDPARPCIALRADIDALPIQENTALSYASRTPGRMHACGHDGHTTVLAGVAGILKSIEKDLPVCVKLIWQPAEEEGGGAERLVRAGVLDGRVGPKVDAIFGLHGWPGLKVGSIATRGGALLAATDSFAATFTGRGAHGAYPHLGRDPIVTAAETIVNLQQFISRELDPTEPAVITVGTIHGGTAVNIIPDTVTITGTVRTLSDAARQQVRQSMQRRVRGIAAANDCLADFRWTEGYPATVNDPAMADYVARIAREALGARNYLPVARPSMGAEDFAFYLQHVPGCYFLLGVEPPEAESCPSLHNDHYDFTDAALAVGMRMFVELAMNWR